MSVWSRIKSRFYGRVDTSGKEKGQIYVAPSESKQIQGAGVTIAKDLSGSGKSTLAEATRYSGGGGGGSPTRIVTTPSGPSPQQQAMAQEQARQQAIREAQARQEVLRLERARHTAEVKSAQEQKIIIKASGGIRTGGHTYVGSAVVPDTGGMTANQYRTHIRQQAIKSGQVDVKDIGYTRFTIDPAAAKRRAEADAKAKADAEAYSKRGSGASVGLPTTFTSEEKATAKMYKDLYAPGKEDTRSYVQKLAFKPFFFIKEAPTFFGAIDYNKIIGGGNKKSPQQESTEWVMDVGKVPTFGTATYRTRTDKELSEEALIHKRITTEDISSQFKFNVEIQKEQKRTLATISPDGITKAEAVAANKNLEDFYERKVEIYSTEREGKIKDIQRAAFKEKRPWEFKTSEYTKSKLPDWKFDVSDFQESLYKKGVPIVAIKTAGAAGSFGYGFCRGVREEPLKIGKSLAIAATITAVTAGVGAYAGGAYGAAAATKFATATGNISKALYGAYGTSVLLRTVGSGSLYGGAETLGRITSTELVPFAVGAKFGGYAAGKVTGYFQSKSPAEFAQEQAALKKLFKIPKGEKLKIQNIRWKRIQEIPNDPKAHKVLENFMIKHKLIGGGTSAIETAGINLRRLPRDFEAYANLGKVSRSKLYAELSRDLKLAGIKNYQVTKQGVIFGGKGHGFNIQDIKTINIERYRWKIYETPSGVKIADPYSTAYNKVFDLLKSAPLGTSQAKAIASKFGDPVLVAKATAGGRIYSRYPKDVVGAFSTAKGFVKKGLTRYGDFNQPQVPGYQEYKLLRYGQGQEILNPYLGKLKFEEAQAIPYYYTGKTAGLLSGTPYVKSYTKNFFENIITSKITSKRGSVNLGSINLPRGGQSYSDYTYLPGSGFQYDALTIPKVSTGGASSYSPGSGSYTPTYTPAVPTEAYFSYTTTQPSVYKPAAPYKAATPYPTTPAPYALAVPYKATPPVKYTPTAPYKPTVPYKPTTPYPKYPSTPTFPTTKTRAGFFRLQGPKMPKPKFGSFKVFGRRFGKWKPVGVGRTKKEAFSLGKKFARTTLGATFKIPGVSGRKLPGYKTKYTKQGALYIEPRKRRLKRGTKEIPEIQFFKRVKSKKKKKKGGKRK